MSDSRPPPDFFIKPGYRINAEASSHDDHTPGEAYWNPERLEETSRYQYDVYRVGLNLMGSQKPFKVADVGCGPAVKTKRFFASRAHEIALFDQESIGAVARAQVPGATFTAIDLERCRPTGKHQFELVICADVLEHLHNPLPCIELCKSLVAANGRILFSTPERDWLRGRNCLVSEHPQHVREWNGSEFGKLLESCGLVMERQMLLPVKRLSLRDRLLRALSFGRVNQSKWKSCQLKVCRLPA